MFINDSYVDNVQTKDLVDLGQSIQGMSAGRVTFLTVPTGETDAEGNEPLRNDDNRALFDAIINDDPLPGENNQNETTTSHHVQPTATARQQQRPRPKPRPHDTGEVVNAVTAEPRDITVHVSNSTGQDGLGARRPANCSSTGSTSTTPDDYSESLPSTTVLFSPGNEQAAATVASALPNPQIERVTGWATSSCGARPGLLHRHRSAAERLGGAGAPDAQQRQPHPPHCRRTSPSPTAPTPRCE